MGWIVPVAPTAERADQRRPDLDDLVDFLSRTAMLEAPATIAP